MPTGLHPDAFPNQAVHALLPTCARIRTSHGHGTVRTVSQRVPFFKCHIQFMGYAFPLQGLAHDCVIWRQLRSLFARRLIARAVTCARAYAFVSSTQSRKRLEQLRAECHEACEDSN